MKNLDRLMAGVHASAIVIAAGKRPVTRELVGEVSEMMLDIFEREPETFWPWLQKQGQFPQRDVTQLHPSTDGFELLN